MNKGENDLFNIYTIEAFVVSDTIHALEYLDATVNGKERYQEGEWIPPC